MSDVGVRRTRHTIHGHRIAVRTAGSGPVVVLVHGMAGSSATWLPVLSRLATRCTLVAPDLLGHGASDTPHTEYSLGAHANVLRDLLVVLGHERATFVGHSLGGGIVMQLAYQFPERCERLVLVGSGGLGQEVNGLLRALSLPGAGYLLGLACSASLYDAGTRMGARLRMLGLQSGPALQEVWRSYGSLVDPARRRAFFRTLRAVIDHQGQSVSATNRLYLAAHAPTLVIWGADDAIIPVHHAWAAHATIPGSRLQIFPDAGHYPHCEQPARFAETLLDFVESTGVTPHEPAWWHDRLRRHAAEVHP